MFGKENISKFSHTLSGNRLLQLKIADHILDLSSTFIFAELTLTGELCDSA